MTKFTEIVQYRIHVALTKVAQRILSILQTNVPAPGKNPFSTGSLKTSLKYSVQMINGSWRLSFGWHKYGSFVSYGTGSYATPKQSSLFGLPQPRGYSRGVGGIQPQFWTSLYGHKQEISDLVKEELHIGINTLLRNIASDIKK